MEKIERILNGENPNSCSLLSSTMSNEIVIRSHLLYILAWRVASSIFI
jgi:hypothetical protein